jgi:hypothetical protein
MPDGTGRFKGIFVSKLWPGHPSESTAADPPVVPPSNTADPLPDPPSNTADPMPKPPFAVRVGGRDETAFAREVRTTGGIPSG